MHAAGGVRAGALLPKTLCPWAGGAVLTPVLLLPLQPTCTSARPCGRAAVCASRPTHASSAAGACWSGAARCGSTAWPTRAAGCTPAAATAAAPSPRSPRYAGTDGWGCPVLGNQDGRWGWRWEWGSPVAPHSSRIYLMFRTEHLLSPLSFSRLKYSLCHSCARGFLAHLRHSHSSSRAWLEDPGKAAALGCSSSCRHVCQ